jgi:hypothetical protein
MNSIQQRRAWIDHVFDHPITDPPWYFSLEDGEEWPEAPEDIVIHIAETFEQSGDLLSRFSDEQLDRGFWYLCYQGPPDFMGTLLNARVPLEMRLRALRSFVPLFEQTMAGRCSPHPYRLSEEGRNALNSACTMWFDIVLDRFEPQRLAHAQLGEELVVILRTILAIPHDACRESALHGIGHWVAHYPQLADIVDRFLSSTAGLRPELISYAQSAKAGTVL